jgi:hypothetical protein
MNEILRNYAENLRRQQTARSTALFMQERGNPDEVANALRLGGELQVPPAAVLAQPERFQMEAEARRTSEIFDRSPRLREWIENDPINGQLAGDDLASLAEWEAMLGNNGSGIGNAVRRGTLQVRAGANVAGAMFAGSDAAQAGQSYEQILSQLADAYGGMEMFGQLPTSIQARLQESAQIRFDMLSSMTEDDALARLETAAEGYAAASDLFTRAQALPVSDRAATFRDGTLANAENTFSGTLGAFFRDPVNGAIFLAETAAETLPVLAGATAATAVARNPAAGAMVMTGGSFLREQSSEAMAFLQERGVDISTPEAALAALSDPALLDEAAGRGLTRGIIIGVLDGLSGGIAGQTLMDNPAGDMVAQALAQGLLAGTGEAGAQLATDGEISPQDVVIEALAELVTLPIEVAGVGGRIGIPSLRRTPEATDLDRAEAAGTTAATLQQIDQMAAQTQTRTRSPDRFAQYLERVGAAEQSVYVPAADFREYAQSQNLNDEEIAALGIDAQEMSDMEQSGGYVAVPLNEYAARIAGTPAAEWFQQNGVLDPATEMSLAMAQREGQSLMDEAMEQARQMRESERELQQTERRVYDEVREQLRQAGRTPDVADSEATFFTAFFNTMAARYGADPFELYERFGLLIQDGAVLQVDTAESVTANLADTQTLEQAAAAVQRTPEFEAWFGDSAVRDANGAPLVVYHGTAENIQAFQDFTGGEDGFYFSSSPDVASGYAAMRGDMVDNADYPDAPGANVIPAYLSLQNPLIVDMGGSAFSADGVQDAVDRAREAGNDGVVFRNMVDPADGQPSASADTIIAFDPYQIKSIFNERPTSDPRILYQDARPTSQQGEVTGVPLATRLSEAFRMAQTRRYRTGRELKLDLQEASLAAQAEAGIDLTTLEEENIDRLADFVVEDALEALQDNANAIGWYDRTITAALEEVAVLHPEILTDQARRLQFTWALAVTSNGLKVDKNFEVALQAYEALLASGDQRFPAKIGIGTAAGQIDGGLAMYGRMLERFGGDHEALAEFMNAQVPVRDLERDFDVKISGEGKGELVRGASILGPKIGNGFFANLYGNFDALTMDRWLMRTVGRWRGTLININEGMIDQKRGEIRELIDGLSQPERRTLSGMLPDGVSLRARMSATQLDGLAVAVQKESMVPAWRTQVNGTPGGENLRKLGNALAKYLDGQVEAPAGARERAFLREVFSRGLARLLQADEVRQASNQELTMSDLQALLWYPEKRLYDTAKQSEGESRGYADEDTPDYANAARAVVRNRLGQGGRTGRAGGRTADDGRGVGAGAAAAATDDAEGVRGAPGGRASFRGRDADVVRVFDGDRPVTEIADPEIFRDLIAQAQADLGPVGAQVTVYDDYAGKRLFLMDDGYSGFALDGDDIISVFSVPGAAPSGAVKRIMEVAVPEGGRRLDAFDTFLPKTYARAGFRAVAKVPFSREFAPPNWDYDFFAQEQGNSDPDIVFMVYDHENAAQATDNLVAEYDDGAAAQQAALAEMGPRTYNQDDGSDAPRGNIQIPAAGVDRGTTVINLFEGRDLSTVIHEGGHYFYEVFATLASDANAPNQMKADLATLQSWMGIQPGQALTTEAHEKMARGMERYVMEGKAPSLELATVFGRFKAWLTNVYRTVRRLNVSLTPEVREVFDRMLATDEAIAQAQADMGGRPMFAEAPANMEQGTWETYQRLERQRTDQANQKMLDKAMDDVRRRREQKWKDERAALVEREMDNLAREPVYRLFEALANQKWIGNEEAELPPRINRDTLEAMGVDLNTISRNVLGGGRAIYTTQADEAGMHPREAAEFFGFPNVGRMIEQLQDSGKRAQRAEERADAVMAQMYPDLLDDASMQAEALEAVHSSRQAEMVALELRHIARQRGQDERRLAARFFQQRARAMIGQMEVRQAVNPNRFLTAERQAARKAEQAFATVARGGRTSAQALAEAQQAKEQQLLNHYLYLEARDLERTVKRKREEMRSYDRQQVRERVGSPHIEQIDAILSAYEFRQRSQRQIDKSMSLARYVELMDKGGVVRLPSGEEVEFTGGRLDELSIDPRVMEDAQRTHYTRLTVDELRGVFDTVDNIAHVGRRTREVVTARGKRLLGESAARVAEQIRDNQRARKSPEGAGAAWQKFVNGLSRVDTIAVRMDGGEEFGTFHAEIKKEIDIAQGEEQARSVEMMERVQETFARHYSNKELRDIKTERLIPGAGTWTKEQLLVLALNTGTESNFQRIMDPRVDESVRMTGDRLDRVLGTLDERDWRFAQDVLDLIDSYYPELAAVNRRMTGVDPKKVEARPMWSGAPAFFRGGYYRLFYDADLGGGAENVEVQNLMTQGMSTGFGASAQVGNGMTKTRLQTAGGKAVRLEFTGITQQLRETVRFITLAETVNGTARILNHPEVKAAFRDTGNQRVKRTLDLWLKDIASGPIFNSDEYNSAARFAKNNFTLSRLAFNWKTVLLQVTGLTQSAVTIGPMNMARGIVRYGRNLTTIHREIIDKSPFMRERMTTFQKDILDFRNEMRMANPVQGRFTNFMDLASKWGFEPMIRTQFHAVDVPTWLGAYEASLTEGQTEQEAVYRADRMVARAQDSALQADRSAVERGTFSETTRQSDVIRLFTTLGGYMIAKMNRANVQILKREMQIKAADTPALRAAIALRLAGDLMVLYAGEAVVMGLLYELMDDDDDYGDLARFVAMETGSTVIGGIPVVRDVAGAFRGFEGGVYGSVTAAPARFAGQVVQGDLDDSAVRAALDLVGTGTGLPSTATYRIVEQFLGEDEGSLGEAVFGSNPLNR